MKFNPQKIGNPDTRRGWAIFWIGCAGFVLSMFFRVSTTVISPDLTRDLNLTTSQLAFLSSAFFYAFALCQLPLGLALDHFGARRVVPVLNGFGVAGALAFALAQTAYQSFFARILMGIGMSCNLMGIMTLIGIWFPVNRFAAMNGLLGSIGILGSLLAATPLAYMAQVLGWRESFMILAGINALLAVCFFIIVRDRPSQSDFHPKRVNPFSGLKIVLGLPSFWGISIGTFFRYGSFLALQGLWAGPYLMNGLGLDVLTTGNALLLLSLGGMIGLPVSGRMSDLWVRSRKWVIMPSFWAMAFLILVLAFLPRGVPVFWIYLLFMLFGVIASPGQIMYSHIKELVPPGVMATSMTGINLFTMLGAAFITQVMGLMIGPGLQDLNHPEAFRPAWYLCATGLGLSGLIYLFIPDSRVLKKGSRIRGVEGSSERPGG
jgi:predicted MFS family arabinose efflux permease